VDRSKHVLLVEPAFPIAAKSRNHKDFLPIGLLKIGSLLRGQGADVRLIRGVPKDTEELASLREFAPNAVWVTSLFTYWAHHVRSAVHFYKSEFPSAHVVVGGIYASLRPIDEVQAFTGCDEVVRGVIADAEECLPAYDLAECTNSHPIDYQILHASRGCPRGCEFCGTWIAEPEFIPRQTIKEYIHKKKVVFYDNNLLLNPHIETLLTELAELRQAGQLTWCESQSGFDGRVLLEQPHLAKQIRRAGFRYPRIAWDWRYSNRVKIGKQVQLLLDAGYSAKDIYVFMIYNWKIPFDEMELKRIQCWDWHVQIADCRFRPLDQLVDEYRPVVGRDANYFISRDTGWTDARVRQFRKNVREQNICVRHGLQLYSRQLEQQRVDETTAARLKQLVSLEEKERLCEATGIDYWYPGSQRSPSPPPSCDELQQLSIPPGGLHDAAKHVGRQDRSNRILSKGPSRHQSGKKRPTESQRPSVGP